MQATCNWFIFFYIQGSRAGFPAPEVPPCVICLSQTPAVIKAYKLTVDAAIHISYDIRLYLFRRLSQIILRTWSLLGLTPDQSTIQHLQLAAILSVRVVDIKPNGTVYSFDLESQCLGPKNRPHPSFRTLQLQAQMLSSQSSQIAPISRISAYGKRMDNAPYNFEFRSDILAQVATCAFHLTKTRTTQIPRRRSDYPRSHSKPFQFNYFQLDNLPALSRLCKGTRSYRSL